jgi:hypothetical protein
MCRMVSSMKRESIPISANEASLIEALRNHGSREFKALADIVWIEPGSSKAMLLHAVFEVGVIQIRNRVREIGYEELMDSYTDEELAEQRAEILAQQARMSAEERV